jgi:hypothetical protein
MLNFSIGPIGIGVNDLDLKDKNWVSISQRLKQFISINKNQTI